MVVVVVYILTISSKRDLCVLLKIPDDFELQDEACVCFQNCLTKFIKFSL